MDPLPPAPGSIDFTEVQPGSFVSGAGGGKPEIQGSATVRFTGAQGLFTVDSLEVFALIKEPDAPARDWESVRTVDGSGPITIAKAEFLVAHVRFACPNDPTTDTFDDTLLVLNADDGTQSSLAIPVHAALPVEGISIEVITPEDDRKFKAGERKNIQFRIFSSFRRRGLKGLIDIIDTAGVPFSCPSAAFIVDLPGTVDVTVPIDCALTAVPGTFDVLLRVGPQDLVAFQAFAFETSMRVIAPVTASLIADFPAPPLFLPAGSSKAFNLVASFSGNATEMDIKIGGDSSRIIITGFEETIPGPGTTTIPIHITAPPDGASDTPVRITFDWRVPSPDGDVSGQLVLNIVIDPASHVYRINEPGGELNLPQSGDVECSHAEVTLSANGTWSFTGSLHDHGTLQGDKFGIAFACNFFKRDAQPTEESDFRSPRVIGTLGAVFGGSRDRNFSVSNTRQFLIDNWHDVLQAGIVVTLQATGSNVFKDIIDAIDKFFDSLTPPDVTIKSPTICLDPDNQPVDCDSGDPGP